VDRALELHDEALAAYELLGDKRSGAVTLGEIARLFSAKGEVDRALELHEESLAIARTLGDQDSIAHTLWAIAQIELRQQQCQRAFEHLAEAYNINLKLARLDGICHVGSFFVMQAGAKKASPFWNDRATVSLSSMNRRMPAKSRSLCLGPCW
jgi:tetratricopeptide (TPR) repeat protein